MRPRPRSCKTYGTIGVSMSTSCSSPSLLTQLRMSVVSTKRISNSSDPGYHRIFIRHGFMEAPDIPAILAECQNDRIVVPAQHATFFFSRLTFLATSKPGMALWRERLFVFLARNSTRASSYFRIPSDQVIEIGWIIEI